MLKGSDQEVNAVASEMFNKRILWLLPIMVPIIGVTSMTGIISFIFLFLSKGFFTTALNLSGVFLGLSGPIITILALKWVHRMPARGRIDEAIQIEKKALDQCLESLSEPGYFNVTVGPNGGAIAVDSKNKKIAIVFGSMQTDKPVKTKLIMLEPEHLQHWRAEQLGISTINLVGDGHSSAEMLGAHYHNLAQSTEQARGTGLRLTTENLDATEIFLNFDFEVAKSWVSLLNKFANGRLEVPSAATEFPKP